MDLMIVKDSLNGLADPVYSVTVEHQRLLLQSICYLLQIFHELYSCHNNSILIIDHSRLKYFIGYMIILFHSPDTSNSLAIFADLITLMDMKDSCYSALLTMAGASLTS